MLRFKIEWSLFWLSLSVGFRTCSLQSLPIQDGGLDCLGQTLGLGPKAAYSCPNGAFRDKRASPYRKWQNFFPLTILEKKTLLNTHNGNRIPGWFPPLFKYFFQAEKSNFWKSLASVIEHVFPLHFTAFYCSERDKDWIVTYRWEGFWVLGFGWSPHLSPA